jgi:HEAT repeat protein
MAAEALRNIGEPPRTVIPALKETLHDTRVSDRERVRVVEALLEYGERPENMLCTLTEAMRNPDWGTRAEALELLKGIGHRAFTAASAVRETLKDEDENVRELAQETLRYIIPPSA